MKIAIMQPYFYPYAGYFRLFAQADLFVVYDCVQFPRRGWLHRNQLLDRQQQKSWLTLPLQKCPQQTLIKDLQFRSNEAHHWWQEATQQFSQLTQLPYEHQAALCEFNQPVVDYLMHHLARVLRALNIECPMLKSSELAIDPALHGQARIVSICQTLKADRYLNSPGGRDLYDEQSFAQAGIQLEFLPDYTGDYLSTLALFSPTTTGHLSC